MRSQLRTRVTDDAKMEHDFPLGGSMKATAISRLVETTPAFADSARNWVHPPQDLAISSDFRLQSPQSWQTPLRIGPHRSEIVRAHTELPPSWSNSPDVGQHSPHSFQNRLNAADKADNAKAVSSAGSSARGLGATRIRIGSGLSKGPSAVFTAPTGVRSQRIGRSGAALASRFFVGAAMCIRGMQRCTTTEAEFSVNAKHS